MRLSGSSSKRSLDDKMRRGPAVFQNAANGDLLIAVRDELKAAIDDVTQAAEVRGEKVVPHKDALRIKSRDGLWLQSDAGKLSVGLVEVGLAYRLLYEEARLSAVGSQLGRQTASRCREVGAADQRHDRPDARSAIGGEILNLEPKFMITARKDSLPARKLLTGIQASNTNDVNVYANRFELIVESRLNRLAGATPWFMAADSNVVDTIEYAYLDGDDGVFLDERVGFDVDGIEYKARLDFGVKAIDFRGLYQNPGQ